MGNWGKLTEVERKEGCLPPCGASARLCVEPKMLHGHYTNHPLILSGKRARLFSLFSLQKPGTVLKTVEKNIVSFSQLTFILI